MKTVLTIAGSDCSGGAGIQADIKTITAHKCYAMSVLAMLTAQNTTGIQSVFEVSNDFFSQQIDSCFSDITPDAVKTGALFSADKIHITAEKLKVYNAKNIVIDPVMVCTANHGITNCLLKQEAIQSMIEKLFQIATIITPNIPEAEVLYQKITNKNIQIQTKNDMENVAKIIGSTAQNSYILLKGGHFIECNDCLCFNNSCIWIEGNKIETKNTHGTGCTLSSAIASNLALNLDVENAVRLAKKYVAGAIRNNPNLGKGYGPINHCWQL